MAVADDGILRIAGDEQDLEVRTRHARGVGKLAAVDAAGQADIGDQQVDPRVRLQIRSPDGPSDASIAE